MTRPRTTPGVGGYLLAYVISVLCFPFSAGAVAAFIALPHGELGAVLLVIAVYTSYASLFSLPFAIVGIPLVHLLSRRFASQAAHVAITGGVTVMVIAVGFAGVGAASFTEGLAIGAGIAVPTMTGRAAVIPLVRRRRDADFRPRERLQA